MEIAAVTQAPAQDLGRIEQLVLGVGAPGEDAGREKQPLNYPGAVQFGEGARHLLRPESRPALVTAGAKGTIVTIALAGRGQHCLEQWEKPAAWADGLVDRQLTTPGIGDRGLPAVLHTERIGTARRLPLLDGHPAQWSGIRLPAHVVDRGHEGCG